jgi:CCR4-NOT transcription complex subunit 1
MCEIITPVVERSVTIACMTTYELVTKDFANDPDESRLRAAAHLMVSSLAGSLALVTCKEPLRVSLSSQLRQMLQPSVDPQTLEQAVSVRGCGGDGGRDGWAGQSRK